MKTYYISVSLLAVSLITLLIIINQQRGISGGMNAIVISLIVVVISILVLSPTIKNQLRHNKDKKLSETIRKCKTWNNEQLYQKD